MFLLTRNISCRTYSDPITNIFSCEHPNFLHTKWNHRTSFHIICLLQLSDAWRLERCESWIASQDAFAGAYNLTGQGTIQHMFWESPADKSAACLWEPNVSIPAGPYGPIWTHMAPTWDQYNPRWAHMDPYQPICAHVNLISAHMVPYWSHLGPYGPVWAIRARAVPTKYAKPLRQFNSRYPVRT